jgi:hypothetical protein
LTVNGAPGHHGLMLKVLLAIALSLSVPGASAQAAPRPAAHPTPAAVAVMAWLSALAAKDAGKLAEASTLPFTFVTDYKRKKCDGTAKDEKAREKIFRCLFSDEKILIRELQYRDENTVIQGAESESAEPNNEIPSKLRRLAGKLGSTEGQSLIAAFLSGDGISFDLLFAVRSIDGKQKVGGFTMDFELKE